VSVIATTERGRIHRGGLVYVHAIGRFGAATTLGYEPAGFKTRGTLLLRRRRVENPITALIENVLNERRPRNAVDTVRPPSIETAPRTFLALRPQFVTPTAVDVPNISVSVTDGHARGRSVHAANRISSTKPSYFTFRYDGGKMTFPFSRNDHRRLANEETDFRLFANGRNYSASREIRDVASRTRFVY